MSSAARIEELQKKFDENPRRYFAPLANECRKAGELDAAIAICRAHLPQQPGHMSGHIVYGQALYESGEIAEARTVFETALGLDPENLIALRHMGDIAAREGDVAGARQWYRRVLETDPRNEEIQALIAGLGPETGGTPAGEVVEGFPVLIDPELIAAAAEATDEAESPFAASDSLLVPTSLGDDEATPSEAFSLDGFEATSFDAPPDTASADTAGDSPAGDIELEFFDREVPHAEATELHPAPAASWDLPEVDEPSWREEAPEESRPVAGMLDAAEPDAFVTETMAELYLRQGYRDQAIAVYRQLVAQNPHDEGLRARLASAEEGFDASAAGGGTADAADAFDPIPGLPDALEPELLAVAADVADERQSAAVDFVHEAPSGPTIREFLAALAHGRPAAAPGAPADAPDTDQGFPVDAGGEELAAPLVAPATFELDEIAEVIDVAAEVDAADRASSPAFEASGAAPVAMPDFDADMAPIDEGREADRPARAAPGLDTLFGSSGDAQDGAAADMLARAYSAEPDAGEPGAASAASPDAQADPLSGRPARPAGNDLSLDSVFGTPRQAGTSRNTGGFSFDQFFAEGAVKTPREESSEPAGAGGGDEDLEQFNSWLHGLKNQ